MEVEAVKEPEKKQDNKEKMDTGIPDKPLTRDDFVKGFQVQQKAIVTQIEVTMRNDIAKLLEETCKTEIKDWRPWRNIMFAYASCIKEAFIDEIEKTMGNKMSEQLLFLAKYYNSKGK